MQGVCLYESIFIFMVREKHVYIYIYGRYVSIRVFLVYIFVISIYINVYMQTMCFLYI